MVQNQFTPSSTAISESNEPLLFGFSKRIREKPIRTSTKGPDVLKAK